MTAIDEEARLSGLREARRQGHALTLDVLSRALDPNHRALLDVGCGHGLFLQDAVAAGFRCEGIEPDATVLRRGPTATPIRQGFFPEVLAEGERFDAIVFNDVLEHIPDVERAMTAASRHLRPRGVLVLNCPDSDGIFYRLAVVLDAAGMSAPLLRMWQSGLPSPHVWYFRADHLARLGAKVGLTATETVRLSPITRKGLGHRISYVRGQSKLLNTCTYVGALLLLPLLGLLPQDSSIVFLRKLPHG